MPDSHFTLYAYADGSDLHQLESKLEVAFKQLIKSRPWVCGTPTLVNQRHAPDSSVGPEDLPDWDLGLNLVVPEVGNEPPGWFGDIQHIAKSLAAIWEDTGQPFVMGMYNSSTGVTEDLFHVHRSTVDLNYLTRIIGVEPPRGKLTG